MFRSLRSRLLALLTGIVVLTVGTIGLASGELVRRASNDSAQGDLRKQSTALARSDSGELATAASTLQKLTRARVFLVADNSAGRAALSGEEVPLLDRSAGRLGLARNGGQVSWTQDGERYTGYASRWRGADAPTGRGGTPYVVVALTEADLSSVWRPLAFQIAAVLAGALVAAWLVALALSYRITRPLHQLVDATNDIARGRYPNSALEGISMDDEIGQLAGAFREMAIKLREVDSRDRRFLMSISHELRTPLTAITGHAQALEDGIAVDEEGRNRSLAVIRREAGRLDRLVEDIIDLARLRSNRFNTVTEMVELNELGEHLMAIFEDQTAHPGVVVRGDFENISFHSDGHRILQILRNLINNGMRYAIEQVRVDGERVRGRIRITVTNDGEPVAPDMQERIFEPFVGSKREGGMGLGLAIGRELAWALGGNLRYVPSDTGAIFELTLPLEPPGSGR